MNLKPEEIYQVFKNLIFKDSEIEPIAEKRLKICFECSYKKDIRCGKCGCILAAKTRNLNSNCPVNKW